MRLSTRQWKKEDFKKLLETEPRFEDFLAYTNQQNRLLESILNGGILFSDNGASFWKTIDVQTFPVSFANALPNGAKPKGVSLQQALDVTTPQSPAPVSLSNPAWQMGSQQGQTSTIQILNVQGVQPNHKYRLTFLVLAG